MSMCSWHLPRAQQDQRPKEANVTDRERYTGSAAELSTPLSVLYSVVEDAKGTRITSRGMPKGSTTRNSPTSWPSYETRPTGGPSVRRYCSPSGWPPAEFVSVLAGLRRRPNTRGPEDTPS